MDGDAEALPVGDDEFDVVTSSFGAMFAPDHQAVANQFLRVCRPGGTIGILNFTPESLAADLFAVLAPYARRRRPMRCLRYCGEAGGASGNCSATGWSPSR
jgi:ubiquinone/menaquinone biosynthesis C-methylase UbiE